MKRIYRQYREPYRLPIEASDFWIIILATVALLVYIAWRYV
jgi:hypothetical protein